VSIHYINTHLLRITNTISNTNTTSIDITFSDLLFSILVKAIKFKVYFYHRTKI